MAAMSKTPTRRRSACPISFSLDILGDKWTLLVLRDLVFRRKRYFRDFLGSAEKIATNILTDRLRTLEHNGIVTRRTDPENARQVIYNLTEKGVDLIPVLVDFIAWGAKYDHLTAIPDALIHRISSDREGLIAELRSTLLGDIDKPD